MTPADAEGQRRRAVVEVMGATLLFSFVGPVAKLVSLGAGAISFWRALFASASLLLVVCWQWRQRRTRLSPRQHASLFAMGALMAGNWYFYILAAQVSSVAIAVVCLFTYPLFSALVEPWLFNERYRWWMVVCSVQVATGVALLMGDWDWASANTRGAVYGILAALSLTGRNLWSRRAVRTLHPTHVTLYQFVVALVLFVPFAIAPPSAGDWGLLALTGALLTTVSQTLFIASLRVLSTGFASILVSVQPIYATLIAWWLLEEVPEASTLLGAALVLAAVFAALVASQRERRLAAQVT